MRLSYIALLPVCMAATGILPRPYAPEAGNRLDLDFNPGWVFHRGEQIGAEAASFNDAGWERVTLPHTVRLEPKVTGGGNYQGIAWYRKSFDLSPQYAGRKIFLEFEAAMGNAELWINGKPLPGHHGGYLPFTVDITSNARFDGTRNVIAVKVDNRDDPETPPGKPQAKLDFNYWGGIYRNAWMRITDKTHITDAVYAGKVAGGGVFVTYPTVSAGQATVQVKTHVANENGAAKDCLVKTTLADSAGRVVAAASTPVQAIPAGGDFTFTQSFSVSNPKLWHPNRPYLYTVHSEVDDGSAFVDRKATTIGIRTIKMTKDKYGFWINGERLELFGANRHQEFLYIGNALPNSLEYRDAKLMREAGMNFCRTGHYPPSPAFMDACDRLGILTVIPMPGWQQYGGATFQQRAYQDVRDMVRRDRNHPSVIAWEANLNETYDMSREFAQNTHKYAHDEYPGDQCFTAGNAYREIYDIPYGDCTGPKPYFTREWSDNYWESMDDTTGTRSARRYGEYDLYNSVLTKDPMFNGTYPGMAQDWCGLGAGKTTMGSAMWAFFDANSALYRVLGGIGAVDADRYPKFNYWWFQSQRDPSLRLPNADAGPMVRILSYWQKGSPAPVKIASNCDQIKLYLNDTLIATLNPDPAFPNVRHPLFTAQVPWRAGTLRADGLIRGALAASHTARTPEAADHIELRIDTMGVPPIADGSDLFLVRALVCDKHGTIVPDRELPMVDDADPSIAYQGAWTKGASKPGNHQATESYSGTAGDFVRFPFTGTEIAWIGIKQGNQGYADVYIDDVLAQSDLDLYASSTQSRLTLFSRTGLANAAHTLKIVVKGTKNQNSSGTIVSIDAFTTALSREAIALSLGGPGSIVGEGDARLGANPNKPEAGIAAFLVRTASTPGLISLSATAGGLAPGTASIRTLPSGTGTPVFARQGAADSRAWKLPGRRVFRFSGPAFALPKEYANGKAHVIAFDSRGLKLFEGNTDQRFRSFVRGRKADQGITLIEVWSSP